MREDLDCYRTVAESSLAGIITTDPDGVLTFINHAFAEMLGYAQNELIGANISRLTGQDAAAKSFNGSEPHPAPVRYETTWRRKDGRELPVLVSTSRLWTDDGRCRGTQSLVIDITDRRQVEQELRRRAAYSALINEVGRRVVGELKLETLLSEIVRTIQISFNYYSVMLLFVDQESRDLTLQSLAGGNVGLFPSDLRIPAGKGMTGRAVDTGTCQVSGDVSKNPYYIRSAGELTKSELAVPIKRAQEVIGVLDIESTELNAFDEIDAAAMETLSTQIAAAINNAQLFEAAQLLKDFNEGLIQNMTEGIVVEDEIGIVTFVNPAVTAMLGFSEKELVNRHWKTIFPPDQLAVIEAADEVRLRGEASRYEVEMAHKNGRRVPVLVSGSPRFEEGRFAGTLAVFTDISELKRVERQIEERQKVLESVLRYSPNAIVASDALRRIIEWNPGAERIFGYRRQEVLGKDLDDLITSPEIASEAKALTRESLAGKTNTIEGLRCRKDGSPINIIAAGSPMLVGDEFRGYVVVYTDITERKKAEEELRRYAQDLKAAKEEQERNAENLARLVKDLEIAKDRAEEATRAKSEFLANMSHEIRTPMNGIIGLTELALDTALSPELRDYLNAVKASAESLLGIINDILDFSKIEAGKLELDRAYFSLRTSIENTMKALALRAHQKGLELTCRIPDEVPDPLIGDPGRLGQIVVNLVGNAIKFTDRGEVAMEAKVVELLPDEQRVCLQFSVHDTGIGIPRDKQQSIFEAFQQADGSTTRNHGGTGLGLTISSKLVSMMSGRIWVESRVGFGSTFHFTACFGMAQQRAAVQVPAHLTDLRVLITDDNATNRLVLQEMLRSWKMKPMAVDGGGRALAALSKAVDSGAPFHVVLLDADMPGMDGFTLAEHIRRDPRLSGVIIMMLTSADQPGDIARCRQTGISSYLVKPIRRSELLDSLLTALGHSGPDAAPAQTRNDSAADRRVRILVAEDNAINQKVVVRMLESAGHAVSVAADGATVLSLLERAAFDLILMDVQMPVLNGFEATARIRTGEREAGLPHTPIVAMTAHAMKGDRQKCLDAGMDDYLSKPIRRDKLLALIQAILCSPAECVATRSKNDLDADQHG